MEEDGALEKCKKEFGVDVGKVIRCGLEAFKDTIGLIVDFDNMKFWMDK